MKRFFIAALLAANTCVAQEWQAEVMAGVSGYNGDLTQSHLSFKTIGPAFNFNIRYSFGGSLVLRGGIGYGKIGANDKDNSDPYLKARNLNFKTNILEGSLCLELNLFESDIYAGYPYLFAGVGMFHFNPYTFDNDGKKTYLQPLGTEGQGLSEYPNKKLYSRSQFCIPFGGGWKWNVNDQFDITIEVGYRMTFTDYLDDVSGTYADAEILQGKRGIIAAQLAYREATGNGISGDIRGNPKVKDWYYFDGLKLCYHLGRKKD